MTVEDIKMEDATVESPDTDIMIEDEPTTTATTATNEKQQDESTRAMSPISEKEREKQEWVKKMRLKFCVRPEFEITKKMIYQDGTLNQE